MPFPNHTHFCCFALQGPHLATTETTELLPGLTVSRSPDPIVLDGVWERWLGTLETDAFKKSTLFITAQEVRSPIAVPSRINLRLRVRLFANALTMLGCGYNSGALLVQGNTAGGPVHIGPISRGILPSPYPGYRRIKRITDADLTSAATMLVSLEKVYKRAPHAEYRRIRKGFNSWIQGVQSVDLGERLHFFVRSVEAILRPTMRRRSYRDRKTGKKRTRVTTAAFVTRGKTIVGDSRQAERMLNQLYTLRSCIEHVKEIGPVLRKPQGISREAAFAFWTLQAEILAGTVYSRIFANEELRDQLRTELRVEGLWRRSLRNRELLFGKSIDLNTETRRIFRQTLPSDLL